MTGYLERLGLTPQERRLVVAVFLALFGVLYFWLVWPRFADWNKFGADMEKAEALIQQYKTEIDRTTEYQSKLSKLEGEGAAVLPEEQANELQRIIQTQASASQVFTTGITPVGTGSVKQNAASQFFEEQAMLVRFATGDSELINFLVSLGSGNSLIRVRDLSMKPDPSQTKLQGQSTVVASYQKKVMTKPALKPAAQLPGSSAPKAAPTNRPASKPARP